MQDASFNYLAQQKQDAEKCKRPRCGRFVWQLAKRKDYNGRISAACGPLGPSLTSNSTSWPSFKLR